jgi:succinate dehydrogenase / fumarate reductase flavoprotein subunit
MQGLADGYFIIPFTIGDYLARGGFKEVSSDKEEFKAAEKNVQDNLAELLSIKGKKTVDDIHKELGRVMWEYVGMARNAEGLKKALEFIPKLRKEFWSNVFIPGKLNEYNPELEKASRLADFLELGELMARDALHREESCGGHFREEYQTDDNEAKRNDDAFTHAAAWEYKGQNEKPVLNKEELLFDEVSLTTRSYK